MPDTTSRAIYTVDWSGQGYEQLVTQMREFLNLKRQVDAAVKQGMGSRAGQAEHLRVMRGGQAATGSATGTYTQQPLITQRELDRQARENQRAQANAQRETDRQAREQQRQRVALQAEQQREEDRQARQHDQARRQQQRTARQQAQATPSVFGAFAGPLPTTDKDWLERQKKMSAIQEEALATGKDLNGADRKLLGATNQRVALLQRRKMQEEGQNPLNKMVNFAGWMLPGQAYYAQMALGETGLGLSMPFMAGALGVAALGAGALSVQNTIASQTAMAQMLAGISTTGGGTYAGPMDQTFAKQIADRALAFNVDRGQANQLLPAIGAYNITNPADIANVLTGGLTRANMGQLTNEQGVQLQSLVTGRMFGGNSTNALAEFGKLDDAIQHTGANAHATYLDILALGDTLTPGTNLTQFAQLEAGLAPTGMTASQVYGGALGAMGSQRLTAAALMQAYGGIPQGVDAEAAYRALQQNPEQFAVAEQKTLQAILAATGGSVSAAQMIAQPFGITSNAAWQAAINGVQPVGYTAPALTNAQFVQQELQHQIGAGKAVLGATPLQNQVGPQVFQRLGNVASNAWQDLQQNPWKAMLAPLLPMFGLGSVIPALSGVGLAQAIQSPPGQAAVNVIHSVIDINLRDVTGALLKTVQVQGDTTLTNTNTVPGPGTPLGVQQVPDNTPSQSSTTGGHI